MGNDGPKGSAGPTGASGTKGLRGAKGWKGYGGFMVNDFRGFLFEPVVIIIWTAFSTFF